MMRVVLILAAVCAALLVVLALTRSGPRSQQAVEVRDVAPAASELARPATAEAAARAATPPPVAAEEPAPANDQVADDAAAVGMTTREPAEAAPEASEEKK